jgi:hypothetical protein
MDWEVSGADVIKAVSINLLLRNEKIVCVRAEIRTEHVPYTSVEDDAELTCSVSLSEDKSLISYLVT